MEKTASDAARGTGSEPPAAESSPEPTCDVRAVHEAAVEAALRERSGEEELAHLADTFQILADPTRLRIVEALSRRELCVCDLAAVVDSSQSSVSHHLRQLRQMQLVRHRREGRMTFYRLDDEHVDELFAIGLEHVRE